MSKLKFLLLSLIAFNANAVSISFLCPDHQVMREGTQCAPDVGCWKRGVHFTVDGNKFYADLDESGKVVLSNELVGKTIYMESGDNFWSPSYCDHLYGPGYLDAKFVLSDKPQAIPVTFRAYS